MIDLLVPSPPLSAAVDLAWYDAVVVATSAGKDSQTALRQVVLEAERQGVSERVIAVHADLGRVEWPGVLELAGEQARMLGVEIMVVGRRGREVARDSKCYLAGEQYGDLLDHVRRMGFWPKRDTRYCTADHKRDPIKRAISAVVAAVPDRGRPARVLNVMGMRAGESPARARMRPLTRYQDNSRRVVDHWLPIHGWTEAEVWRDVWRSGIPWHWAYDMGMPRLSCSLCVLSSAPALRLAGILRPELLAEYAEVEAQIGHSFQRGTRLHDVLADVSAPPVELARRWGQDAVRTWEG